MTEPAMVEVRKPFDRHAAINRVLDEITELTEPRNISNPLWSRKKKRTVFHVHTLPSLIEALRAATSPGADISQQYGAKEFESRPAARISPIYVLTKIEDEAKSLCDDYDLRRATLNGYLMALKGHAGQLEDHSLRVLDAAVKRWGRMARLATGEDPMPITLSDRCPVCGRKNKLTITGDMQYVRCDACKIDWDEHSIGIFAQMLENNRTHETLAVVKCDAERNEDRCYLLEGHEKEHRGNTGRYWWDDTPETAE